LTGEAHSIPTAAVLAVGDELLYGTTVNTNGSWLARELSDLGLAVTEQRVVGDDEADIVEAVDLTLRKAELLLVTGGLGPTADDRTRRAVARQLGASLEPNQELLERLKDRFRSQGHETLPAPAEAMALVPEGARILTNPIGAAPGLVLETLGNRVCVLLPGIPSEMKGIFRGGLSSFLMGRFGPRLRPVIHRVIHIAGVPESVLASEIDSLLPDHLDQVDLAYLPDVRGLRLRLSTRAGHLDPDPHRAMDEVEAALQPALAGRRYFADSGDLAESVGGCLLSAAATVAVAESCTGGLIAKRLTDRAGSSRFFLGGIVAYANEVKSDLLGVPMDILERHGAVSEEVAGSMARGVAGRLGARFGIGTTGIAGPGGGSDERPVGTVWLAVSSPRKLTVRRERFPGGREEVRERAAQAALHLLLRVLEGDS
jgi:nicotinamide-nucleotide amidase